MRSRRTVIDFMPAVTQQGHQLIGMAISSQDCELAFIQHRVISGALT